MTEDTSKISDGHHTFGELYEHRHALFLALVRQAPCCSPWMSKKHHDGTAFAGWFIAGLTTSAGMISYHLPDSLWEATQAAGAKVLECGLPWDGHTSRHVVARLMVWATSDQSRPKSSLGVREALLDLINELELTSEPNKAHRIPWAIDRAKAALHADEAQNPEDEFDRKAADIETLRHQLDEANREIGRLKAREGARLEAVRGLMANRATLVEKIIGLNLTYKEHEYALSICKNEILAVDERVREFVWEKVVNMHALFSDKGGE